MNNKTSLLIKHRKALKFTERNVFHLLVTKLLFGNLIEIPKEGFGNEIYEIDL